MRPLSRRRIWRTEGLKVTLSKLKGIKSPSTYGICVYSGDSAVQHLVKYWPKYSGNKLYPVPHPTLHPRTAYDNCSKWDKRTQYGKDRWELLQFIIKHIEDELKRRQS